MTRAAAYLLPLLLAAPAWAQQTVLSPRDSVTIWVDSTSSISVNYGRPSMRGRTIMGALVPWSKVWRTGANLATHLRTTFDMTFGGMPIPRGTYTLYSIPGPSRWNVIINNQTGQWGTQYDERQDRARISVVPSALSAAVDTFRISLAPNGRSAGLFRMAWERTLITIPFERNDRIHPVSPLDSATITIAGKTVKIRYSRPFMRGRVIWGTLVPFDSVWRTGANAVTSLWTDGEITIGGTAIPRGSYSLYSIPSERGLLLVVNRQVPGPTPEYQPALDIARISMTPLTPSAPIDPLRIWLTASSRTSCTLQLGWDTRAYSTIIKLR